MNLNQVERDVKVREHTANRLEGSILFLQLQPDHYKHQEALWLLNQKLFMLRDQLFNYRMLVNLLKEDENGSVPETK